MSADDTNAAMTLAIDVLAWVVSDPDRAERLLALTGLDASALRAGVGDPAVLSGVIGFLNAHEPDLIACATALDVKPAILAGLAERINA